MFAQSQFVNISGGTFSNINAGANVNPEEVLRQHIAAGALHDSAERSDPPICHPGTRTAVLEDIMSWIEDKDSEMDILWLRGPAGSGKTAICQTIAEMCQNQGDLAASFFFSRGGFHRNNDKFLIPTIAYQIAQSIEQAKSYIEAAVIRDFLVFQKALATQLRQLIVQPLKEMMANFPSISRPRLLLIDGLDECQSEEVQINILRAFHTASTQGSFPFRILIASRMEPHIRDTFEAHLHDSAHYITLNDAYDPDKDIATYLRSSFAAVLRKHRRNRSMASLPLPWPSESVIRKLVSKASGQFIYASTVIKFVDVRHQLPSHRLDMVLGLSTLNDDNTLSPFAELDMLYQEIFRAVLDVPFTLHVLGGILILSTPIPVDDLERLLGLRPGDVELALCNLHSVLSIPDSLNATPGDKYIRIYHASLQDFLFDPKRAGPYYVDPDSAHSYLIKSCCHHLASTKIRSILPFSLQSYARREGTVREAIWEVYIDKNTSFHILSIKSFNEEILSQIMEIPPITFLYLLVFNQLNRWDLPLYRLKGRHWDAAKRLDQISLLIDRFRSTDHPKAQKMAESFTTALDIFFRESWRPRFERIPHMLPKTLAILCAAMQDDSTSPRMLTHLLNIDWKEFGLATFVLLPHITFDLPSKFLSSAFRDYIQDPSRCGQYYPLTADIHADLVIYCVEYLNDHSPPTESSSYPNTLDMTSPPEHYAVEQAHLYSTTHWREHLKRADPRRLLNYVYFSNVRTGYYPICPHQESPCNIRCEVVGLYQCIESRIIDNEILPPSISMVDSVLLPILKEIVGVKYMGTSLFSMVKLRMEQWKSQYREKALSGAPNPYLVADSADTILGDYEVHDVQEALVASRLGRNEGQTS